MYESGDMQKASVCPFKANTDCKAQSVNGYPYGLIQQIY